MSKYADMVRNSADDSGIETTARNYVIANIRAFAELREVEFNLVGVTPEQELAVAQYMKGQGFSYTTPYPYKAHYMQFVDHKWVQLTGFEFKEPFQTALGKLIKAERAIMQQEMNTAADSYVAQPHVLADLRNGYHTVTYKAPSQEHYEMFLIALVQGGLEWSTDYKHKTVIRVKKG